MKFSFPFSGVSFVAALGFLLYGGRWGFCILSTCNGLWNISAASVSFSLCYFMDYMDSLSYFCLEHQMFLDYFACWGISQLNLKGEGRNFMRYEHFLLNVSIWYATVTVQIMFRHHTEKLIWVVLTAPFFCK
jgi:hypothetical protein